VDQTQLLVVQFDPGFTDDPETIIDIRTREAHGVLCMSCLENENLKVSFSF